MNREDIIRMAQEAGLYSGSPRTPSTGRIIEKRLEAFAALVAAAERNKLAQWMMTKGYATGHGDTVEDLLRELEWQIAENWTRGMVNGVQAEREACAKVTGEFAQKWWSIHCASNKHMETTRKAHDDFCALQAAIRARGETK